MRRSVYNPRTGRYEWQENPLDNAGDMTIDTSGDPSIGLGGGLGIDLVNGDLTMKVAPGFSIDLGGGSDPFSN